MPDRLTIEQHALGRGFQSAGHSAEERRLAGAVGADDGNRLALLDRYIDAEQGLEITVKGRKVLGLQQRHDSGMPM